MKKNKTAITLVELMVVFVILSILSVIGLLSLSSYLVSVRDSKRLVELENIEESLGSYVLKSSFYPEPSDGKQITYSGTVVWTQGTFGKSVSDIVGYSKDNHDPLTKNEYTYSVKNTRKEYSIAGVLEERPGLVASNFFVGSTNAEEIGTKKGIALVKGNYNGEVTSILLNGVTNILALPSIITSDLSSLDLLNILDNNKLVYNDFGNLPASYTGTVYNLNANTDFAPSSLLVYSGSISNLKETYNQVKLLQDVHLAYSGSILGKKVSVNKVDYSDLFSPEPSSKVKILACDLINFKVKYFVECGRIDFITFFVINVLGIDIGNLPGTKITTVYQDSSGRFIFGTNGGLAFYDGVHWLSYNQQDSGLVHNYITSVSQDNLGNYWIGTQNGINKFVMGDFTSKADDIWVTFNKNLLDSTHIQYIYTDNNGVVWVGTNQGVTSYNGDVWSDYIKKSDGLTHNNITAIYHDSAGYVWFGTNAKGLDRYKLSDKTVTNYNSGKLPNQKVTYIFEATGGTIWAGTEGGLAKLPDHGASWQSFTNISTLGGLIGDNITYLFQDTLGNIRTGTTAGLSKYNGTTWEKWSTLNGLKGNYIFLLYEDDNGYIIVFSDGGLDAIDTNGDVVGL